jgi:hypothetical protein
MTTQIISQQRRRRPPGDKEATAPASTTVKCLVSGHKASGVTVTAVVRLDPDGLAVSAVGDGNRAGSKMPFILQSALEQASHRGPGAAAADRTPIGAYLEARFTVEAQCRPAQRQVESPDRLPRAQ